jgi:putative selenate reductase molybdopterin-binding subunit
MCSFSPYDIPNVRSVGYDVVSNRPKVAAYRAPGAPISSFAVESAIDDLARKLNMDPIELRLKNAIRQGDTDLLSAELGEGKKGLARVIRSCGLPECLAKGAAAIGWKEKRAAPRGTGRLRRGVGVACSMQGSGIAGVDFAGAYLKINEDGSFNLHVGATDLGTGSDTVLAQIAAETLGVGLEKILIYSSDTDFTPFDVGAYASSTTIISGGAVKKAAEKARDQVCCFAAKMLETSPEELTCRDNRVFAPDGKSVTMSEVAMFALYKEKTQLMEGASHFNTDSPPPFCATFAEVEVDTETGVVRPLHIVTAVDLGVAINPMQAEGQAEGAVAQGLGYTLAEELVLDEKGRVVNPNFCDYKIFGAKDMPKLTTILVETEEPLGPFGAKSIAEVPINGVAPAIANALFHALGVRFRKLPIRPDAVLAALQSKRAK